MGPSHGMRQRYAGLDAWADGEILDALWAGQAAAIAALHPVLPELARIAQAIAARLARGGRLVYAGAGTSGALARFDGIELPGTFGIRPEQIRFLTAGGLAAFDHLSNAAEDDAAAGLRELAALGPGPGDAVLAVAASGATPYTLAIAGAAHAAGAYTAAVVCRPDTPLAAACADRVVLASGEEVVEGSTRLAAGTAQKAALNLISTLVGIRLGGVHGDMMVGMPPTNAKLVVRATGMVARIAAVPADAARMALNAAGGDVRLAVLLARGAETDLARATLHATGGNLRMALARLDPDGPHSDPDRTSTGRS